MTLFVFCALTRPSVWCLMVNGFFFFFSLLFFLCVYFLYDSIINKWMRSLQLDDYFSSVSLSNRRRQLFNFNAVNFLPILPSTNREYPNLALAPSTASKLILEWGTGGRTAEARRPRAGDGVLGEGTASTSSPTRGFVGAL